MSENQSDCFFSMLEHATVPVRETKFAEMETGLYIIITPCINAEIKLFLVRGRNKAILSSK